MRVIQNGISRLRLCACTLRFPFNKFAQISGFCRKSDISYQQQFMWPLLIFFTCFSLTFTSTNAWFWRQCFVMRVRLSGCCWCLHKCIFFEALVVVVGLRWGCLNEMFVWATKKKQWKKWKLIFFFQSNLNLVEFGLNICFSIVGTFIERVLIGFISEYYTELQL